MAASGNSEDQQPQGGTARSSMRGTFLKVLISVTLLGLILRYFKFEELKQQIVQTEPVALLLPILIVLVGNILGAVQWAWLLKTAGVGIRLPEAIRLYFVGLFFNNFLFGNLGGDVYKIYAVGRQHDALGRVAGATLVDRLVGVSALCTLALLAALSALVWGQIPVFLAVIILLFSVGIMTVAGIILHPSWGERVQGWLERLPFGNLSQRLARLMSYLREYRECTRILNGAFVLSLFIQSSRVLAHFFVGIAMGWSMMTGDLAKFFLAIPVLGLISVLPISIGGWGVREWAAVAVFAPLGRDGSEAITLTALTASLTLLVSMLGGLVLLWRQANPVTPDNT